MRSISAVFEEKARAFTEGYIAGVAAGFVVPTSIYLGEHIIHIPDRLSLLRILSKYRDNLMRHDYAKTQFENITETIIGSRAVRVALDWIDFDGHGRVIGERETCFYCTQPDGGKWNITPVNMLQPPAQPLLEGLQVH